jgi:hypothetical protein
MTQARRLLLQTELEGYFADDPRVTDASLHVSFQPDEESQIKYPHIVYSRDPAYRLYADNIRYLHRDKYQLTYIDRKPDSLVFDELEKRPYCSHSQSFVVDGLHHDVFDLYH